MTDEVLLNSGVAPAPAEPEWYVMDGMPGQGSRPEYLETKYKSMAEQAKAYKELQKTLGSTSGAPEEYDFGQHKEYIDAGNPEIASFIQYAKQNRISQDAFSKVLDTFTGYQKSKAPNIDEEIAKLGPDGAQKIGVVKQWAENNLSQKSLDALGSIATRAEVIEMLDELRQFQYHSSSQPPGGDVHGGTFTPISREEVEAEMASNYKRYSEDASYRKYIAGRFEQAVG